MTTITFTDEQYTLLVTAMYQSRAEWCNKAVVAQDNGDKDEELTMRMIYNNVCELHEVINNAKAK